MKNYIKQKSRIFVAFIFILIIFSVVTLGTFCNDLYLSSDKNSQKHFDAIVLLAGGVTERVPVAVKQYCEGSSLLIILTNDGVRSRWSPKYQRNLYNIEWTQEMLIQSGIPASSIIMLPYSASGTVYDARAVRTYLKSHPAKSLLLVTSDYHARRTLWIFRRVLRDMSVHVDVAPAKSGWSSVVPILLEPIKTAYYWVRYGLLEVP